MAVGIDIGYQELTAFEFIADKTRTRPASDAGPAQP
jgi:hypothetical protein